MRSANLEDSRSTQATQSSQASEVAETGMRSSDPIASATSLGTSTLTRSSIWHAERVAARRRTPIELEISAAALGFFLRSSIIWATPGG